MKLIAFAYVAVFLWSQVHGYRQEVFDFCSNVMKGTSSFSEKQQKCSCSGKPGKQGAPGAKGEKGDRGQMMDSTNIMRKLEELERKFSNKLSLVYVT